LRVRVSFLGILAEYAGVAEVEVELAAGATIADLHRELGRRYAGRFPPEVWDPQAGRFSPYIHTFLEEQDVEDPATPLHEGSQVILLTMIAGGLLSRLKGLHPGSRGRHPRLPPGQRLTEGFPILHLGPVPPFTPASWDFVVEGEVENPLHLAWTQFQSLPRVTRRSDFHCVTGWSRLGDEWEGIPVGSLLALARPRPEARFALVVAEGGYTTSLTLAELSEDDVLLALRLNGAELPPEHGGPVRLLVPRKYAYKSAKWVRGIRLSREEQWGYWERRGYSQRADPWRQERYAG